MQKLSSCSSQVLPASAPGSPTENLGTSLLASSTKSLKGSFFIQTKRKWISHESPARFGALNTPQSLHPQGSRAGEPTPLLDLPRASVPATSAIVPFSLCRTVCLCDFKGFDLHLVPSGAGVPKAGRSLVSHRS